jgi:hypothetical protein
MIVMIANIHQQDQINHKNHSSDKKQNLCAGNNSFENEEKY